MTWVRAKFYHEIPSLLYGDKSTSLHKFAAKRELGATSVDFQLRRCLNFHLFPHHEESDEGSLRTQIKANSAISFKVLPFVGGGVET